MRKKGVTSIVATVLLLMITVAVAGAAYVWIMDMQDKLKVSTEENLVKENDRSGARLTIESGWNENGYISLSLKNSGTYTFGDVSKFSVYVDGRPEAGVTYSPTGALSPGGVTTVSLTNTQFVTVNNPKTIKITTDIGTDVSYRCTIPVASQTYCS